MRYADSRAETSRETKILLIIRYVISVSNGRQVVMVNNIAKSSRSNFMITSDQRSSP